MGAPQIPPLFLGKRKRGDQLFEEDGAVLVIVMMVFWNEGISHG